MIRQRMNELEERCENLKWRIKLLQQRIADHGVFATSSDRIHKISRSHNSSKKSESPEEISTQGGLSSDDIIRDESKRKSKTRQNRKRKTRNEPTIEEIALTTDEELDQAINSAMKKIGKK